MSINRKPSSAVATIPTPNLSAQTGASSANRVPAEVGPLTPVTYGAFLGLVPSADVTLLGLRDTVSHGVGVQAMIFDENKKIVAQSSPVPLAMQGSAFDGLFPKPAKLVGGNLYYIGWSCTAYQPLKVTTAPSEYKGYLSHGVIYTSSEPLGQPGRYFGGYFATFALLEVAGSGSPKTVNGPLDAADFPIVTNADALGAGAAAILDTGSNPPRLIRKRLDGSLWYGAPFTNTP